MTDEQNLIAGIDFSQYRNWPTVVTESGGTYYEVPGTPYVYNPFLSAAKGKPVLHANPRARMEEQKRQRELQERAASPTNQLLPVAAGTVGTIAGAYGISKLVPTAADTLAEALATKVGTSAATNAATNVGASTASNALGGSVAPVVSAPVAPIAPVATPSVTASGTLPPAAGFNPGTVTATPLGGSPPSAPNALSAQFMGSPEATSSAATPSAPAGAVPAWVGPAAIAAITAAGVGMMKADRSKRRQKRDAARAALDAEGLDTSIMNGEGLTQTPEYQALKEKVARGEGTINQAGTVARAAFLEKLKTEDPGQYDEVKRTGKITADPKSLGILGTGNQNVKIDVRRFFRDKAPDETWGYKGTKDPNSLSFSVFGGDRMEISKDSLKKKDLGKQLAEKVNQRGK